MRSHPFSADIDTSGYRLWSSVSNDGSSFTVLSGVPCPKKILWRVSCRNLSEMFTIFTITMVLVLFGISEYQTIPSYALVIASVVSFLIVAWFSPVSHKNKPLKKREIVIYQKVAVSISGVLLSLVIILLQFEREIATIITLAMLTTSIAMIVSVVMERSEKNERNCNAR